MIVISEKSVDDKVDTDAGFWPEFMKEEPEFTKDDREDGKEKEVVGRKPAEQV